MLSRPSTKVFIAVSLDGFIARPGGELDWLMQAQATAPAGEDFGYARFMESIDTLVMGRKTFDTVLGFDPWPYVDKSVHVLTRQSHLQVPAARQPQVTVSQETPSALLTRLGNEGVGQVYLDGGELIQSFLCADLVDFMTITTVPVLLGQGRRLFGSLPQDQAWQLVSSKHWACGFVQNQYRRAPDPTA